MYDGAASGQTRSSLNSPAYMNFLILGSGPEEHVWARELVGSGHAIVAAHPGLDGIGVEQAPRQYDFEAALATPGIEAVLVGGALAVRGEWLRRVAAEGWPSICLHPPGADSEAYYQVAMARQETGALVVPDMPLRLHPGLVAIQRLVAEGDATIGALRGLRVDWAIPPERDGETPRPDLAREIFPRMIDAVRSILGEVEALSATGDPTGLWPTASLVVQIRAAGNRRAEVRIERGVGNASEPTLRVVAQGSEGSLALEADTALEGPARLVRRTSSGESRTELATWEPRRAILKVLNESIHQRGRDRDSRHEIHPNLLDGTRAMGAGRSHGPRSQAWPDDRASLRGDQRGWHVQRGDDLARLHALPGRARFASPRTGWPGIGIPATLYLAYAIPPLLIGFILLQVLRFAVRRGDRPD